MEIPARESEKEPASSLNIAILPPQNVTERSIELSGKISDRFPTIFRLNQDMLIPHITAFQSHVPDRNIGKVIDAIRQQTGNVDQLRVTLEKINQNRGDSLFWDCEKTDALLNFHMSVVNSVNPLREGLVLPHLAGIPNQTEEDLKDKEHYGALLIGPRYRPHITLTVLQNPKDMSEALKFLQNEPPLSFIADRLIVGYLGPRGVVNGIIETIPLKAA